MVQGIKRRFDSWSGQPRLRLTTWTQTGLAMISTAAQFVKDVSFRLAIVLFLNLLKSFAISDVITNDSYWNSAEQRQ